MSEDQKSSGASEDPPVVTVSGDASSAEQAPLSVTTNLPSAVWPPKNVGDLMTRKVIAVSEAEPIGELETWMGRFRFHHLPVVDGAMKLVGLITQTDFLHARLGRAPDGRSIDAAGPDTKAGDIMRKNVVFAHMDHSLQMAGEAMLREQLGCLPVVLDDKTLVGIVSTTDFVKFAVESLKRA